MTIQEIDEPFEVTEFDDDEAAAVLKTVDSDVDGIDMPKIDMTDIDTARLDASDTFVSNQELLARPSPKEPRGISSRYSCRFSGFAWSRAGEWREDR